MNEGNFRENLKRVTGIDPGKVAHAHHILPKDFVERFTKIGIDVHNPKFGSWWVANDQLEKAWEYNQKWIKFLKQKPSRNEVLNKALEMAYEYNFKSSL